MARMTIKSGEEFTIKLTQYLDKSDEIAKKAIYKASKIVADEMKKRLQENLDDPSYVGKKDTLLGVKISMLTSSKQQPSGDLIESLGIAPIAVDSEGNWNTKIGFDGYDKKGVSNALKARVMESGSSYLRKRPFVRPAVNATRKKAIKAMNEVIKEETSKIFKE